jgi:RHS repeat-associated protein
LARRDQIAVVRGWGFTPRQARFLMLVLEHSGVCLPRQYRTFAGIAHGRHTHRVFAKLITDGFATTDLIAPAHAGRIYHVQYKPWYRAIGEPDHPHRRATSVGRAVERLMVLDGVLAERVHDEAGRGPGVGDVLLALRLDGSTGAQGHPERRLDCSGVEGWQVRTAGGGVQADNGAWHHFTVAGEPLATWTAGPSGGGAPGLGSAKHRSTGSAYAAGVAGAAGLALAVLLAGPRRRRRVVAAGVLVVVLAPAAALAQTTTQVVEYYTTDALGSVRAVTQRVNGVLQVTRHDFMPFGEEVAPPTASQDKRLFTGKERDSETGMDYFGARYCRSGIGQFTTIDPLMTIDDNLVDPQRWNRYAYARNNPLRYTDPTGLYIVGCDTSNSDCAAAMKRFEDLRQRALQNKDSTVRAIAHGLGGPGQKGTTVTPDFLGTLGKNDNANYDSKSDTLLFKPQISGPEGVRTIVHEGSHRLDTAIANAKPEFDEAQITRWESEIRAYDAGARVRPYVVLNGVVLRPGDRKAIEGYMGQIPPYRNTGWYPLVERRYW